MSKQSRNTRDTRDLRVVSLVAAIAVGVLCIAAMAPPAAAQEGAPIYVLPGGQAVKLGAIPETPAQLAAIPVANLPLPPYGKSLLPTAAADISSNMPPIGNQGAQGSCTAWATGYYYKSYQEGQEHSWDLSTANHQFSPAFIYNQINGGTDDGSSISAAMRLMSEKGCATLADMPYSAADFKSWPSEYPGGAQIWLDAIAYRADGYEWWPTTTEVDLAALKHQLDLGEPFVIGIPIYDDFGAKIADDDYYERPADDAEIVGYHAICIVGYDDDKDRGDADDSDGDGDIDADDDANGELDPEEDDQDIFGGFLFVNSWGAAWAGDGKAYLSYGFVMGVIDPINADGETEEFDGAGAAFFMTDKIGYQPSAWAECDLPCESRDDVVLTIGRQDGSWSWTAFNQQGADDKANIHAYLDLTDALAYLPPTLDDQWKLQYTDAEFKYTGSIETFTVFVDNDLDGSPDDTYDSADTTGALAVSVDDLGVGTAYIPGPGAHAPTLTDPSMTPTEGLQGDTYTFGITYTDLDDNPPPSGRVWLLIENTTAGTPLQALAMEVDTTAAAELQDGDYTNGERYTVSSKGIRSTPTENEIGDGHHRHYFVADEVPLDTTSPEARYPTADGTYIDGPLVNDPPEISAGGYSPESPDFPDTLSGEDVVVIHDSTPTFNWDAATDINATDTAAELYYMLQLSQSKTFAPVAYEYTTGPGETEFTVPDTAPLSEGVWYWRLRTYDDDNRASAQWTYAGGVPYLSTQLFRLDLNQPPYWDGALARGDFVPDGNIRTLTPLIDWPDATDPDPADPPSTLSYHLVIDDNMDFSTPHVDVLLGPGVTEYQLGAGEELIPNRTYYYQVKAIDDQGAESDWHNAELTLDPPSNTTVVTDFVLQNPTLSPVYGGLGTDFAFSVEYVDANNLAPPDDIVLDIGGGTLEVVMTRDPADGDAYDVGVTYLATVNGAALGYGAWDHYFYVANTPVRFPGAPVTLPGPIIGSDSVARFTTAGWADVATYEEGDTLYVEVTDADENQNPGAAETVNATITEDSGTETETLTLTETGNNTGVFRGQINSIGRAGADNNGTFELVAGPAGRLLTVTYNDPTGGDSATDTAGYQDTVAPAALAAGELVATTGPHGMTIGLDWTAYDEAAQVDVAGYHVWRAGTDFADSGAATQVADVPAGTQTWTDTAVTPGQTWFYAVTPYDEVPNENTAVNTAQETAADSTAPYLANQDPAPDAVEVARDSNIAFDVLDAGSGVDPATLTVAVNGTEVTASLVVTPTAGGLHVDFDPAGLFDYNEHVAVAVRVRDNAGNELHEVYYFDATSDTQAPQVTNKAFDADAGTVSFNIEDDISGVDVSTLVFQVDGVDVTASATINAGNPLDVSVSYAPPGGWGFNATVDFSVDVSDIAGNAMATDTWQESSATDAVGPTIDQLSPPDGSTDVLVSSAISARVRDNGSGVDVASITMSVNGTDVTADLSVGPAPAQVGVAEVIVTYQPPADLDWATDYDVHLEASDEAGNTTTADWSFTTEDEPTYEIRGFITNVAGDPLPGVDVTVDGQTVGTDGNGAYRVRGLVAGTYTVTPTLAEHDFTPVAQQVTVGPSARDVNFVGAERIHEIRGRVTHDGAGVAGVQVSDGTRSAMTDANGDFAIADVPNGIYTVSCSRDANSDGFQDFTYTPASRTVNVVGADVTGVDFTATTVTYTISGRISDSLGNRIAGVTVSDGTRTAVTSEAGEFTIGGVPASTVVLTASKAGLAFDPETLQVTVPPSSTGNNFTAYTEFVHQFAAGLQMVAVPASPPAGRERAVDIFQTLQVARWDASATPAGYVRAADNPDHLELAVRPGASFFVNFPARTTVNVPGDPVGTTGTFSVGVSTGWNMLGNMYESALPLANITAAGSTEIRPYAFIWDNTIGSYRMISRDPAINSARNYIEAWEGAWFKATGAAGTLNVAAPTAVSAASLMVGPAAATDVAEGGWLIPIEARAAGRADISTVAGVGTGPESQGYRVENPPRMSGTVDVYFTDDSGERLAHDIRPASAGPMVWTFAVETDLPDAEVQVLLPDLSAVPRDLAVYLTDLDTGERMYARTLPAYSFTTGADGALRHFALEVAPQGADALTIRSAAVSGGAAGMMVTYDVSSTCNLSIEVLNIAGRPVRTLVQSRAVPAGQGQQLWDLRSAEGTLVPAGTYLIRLEAVAENGQRVQALRSAQVAR